MRLFTTLLTVFGIIGVFIFAILAKLETKGSRFTLRNVAGPLLFTVTVVIGMTVIMFISIFTG